MKVQLDDACHEIIIRSYPLESLDTDQFFDLFPYFYFKPKDEDYQLYAKGTTFHFHDYPKICAELELPLLTIGHSSHDVCDFLKLHSFIPKTWVIKTKDTITEYTIDSHPALDVACQIHSQLKETSKEFALAQIEKIIETIKEGQLEKCVFAQVQVINNPNPLSISKFIKKSLEGTCFFYQFTKQIFFCGASPEWIYKRKNSQILIEAIAGTAKKENVLDLEEPKILEEFGLVKKGIHADITPYISQGCFDNNDTYLTHHQLIHRYNAFKGTLLNKVCDKDLILALHPTPAISGTPKKEAQSLIKSLESFPRGFYSSPVGFYTGQTAYIACAIRSMLVCDDTAYLFSGAGIVKNSQSEDEWLELCDKISYMQSLI
jgi:isochorismate synthase EntC